MNQTGKILLMLIVFISTFSIAQAQRGDRSRSNADIAKRTSKVMKDSLALSDAQMVKIDEVNLKYVKKMSDARTEARANAEGDYTNIREMMQKIRAEQNTELKQYMTSEQFAKWEKMQANRKGRRGKGRRGPKGKRGDRNKKGEKKSDDN